MSDDDAPGLERQVKLCRELAARLGIEAGELHADNDRSATTGKRRPEFERLLAARPPGILAWHPDRLIRVMRDLERVILLDVPVYTVEAGHIDLSTPSGRMVARQLTAVAQYEGEHKAARQRAASRQRAEAGLPPLSPSRPFGYDALDGMALLEVEADAIREAYEAVLSGSAGVRAIGRRWTAAGFTTRAGNPWTSRDVVRALRNPRYAALPHYRFDLLPGVVARWPGVVDPEVWRAVQGILDDPTRRTSPPPDRRYLLSWLARCGLCEGPMQTGATHAKVRTLKCAASRHLERAALPIEDYVTAVTLARLRRPDLADLLAEQQPDLAPLRTRAAALQAQRDELAGDVDLPLEVLKVRDRALREQLAELDARLATAARTSALAEFVGHDPEPIWRDKDLAARRGIIAELMTVTVLPAGRGARVFDRDTVRCLPHPD